MTRDQKLISVLELMVKNDVAHLRIINMESEWLSAMSGILGEKDSRELQIFERISNLSRMSTCRLDSFDTRSSSLLALRGLEPQS